MMATPCCCCPTLFADDFNRADETINDNPATDSTGHWTCLSTGAGDKWKIDTDRLALIVSAGQSPSFTRPYAKTSLAGYHRQLRVSVRFMISSAAATLPTIFLTMEVHGSASQKISASAVLTLSDATHCGLLEIGGRRSTIPLDKMSKDEWHTLTICADMDLQIFVTHVVTASGEVFANHVHALVTAGSFTPLSTFTLGLHQQVEGSYYFDDFAIQHTRAFPSAEYGYGYGENSTCPCCGPGGCEEVSDDFEDGVIDCRWLQQVGSWTETGGTITSGDSGAILQWLGMWSGLDDDCLPDDSVRITASAKAALGESAIIYFDLFSTAVSHYAKVTWPSTEEGSDGTIKIFSTSGGELATSAVSGLRSDTNATITVCWDGFRAIATVNSTTIEADDASLNGVHWALGGTAIWDSVTTSYNIYGAGCQNCGPPVCESTLCDAVPPVLKVRFTGSGLGIDGITYVLTLDSCCDNVINFPGGGLCTFTCNTAIGSYRREIHWSGFFVGASYIDATLVEYEDSLGAVHTALVVLVGRFSPSRAYAKILATSPFFGSPTYPCRTLLTTGLPEVTVGLAGEVFCNDIDVAGGTACEVWGE
jgi:hypothetical protein